MRIHIAPVGFEVDRIVLPAENVKADRVWLIVHDEPNKDAGQPFSKLITESLRERRIELRLQSADRTDLFDTLRMILYVSLAVYQIAYFLSSNYNDDYYCIQRRQKIDFRS